MRTALLSCALLAACSGEPTDAAGPDTCGAAGLQRIVGSDKSVLASMSFVTGTIRVIEPGAAVTLDYRADRTNMVLDPAGRITEIYCG